MRIALCDDDPNQMNQFRRKLAALCGKHQLRAQIDCYQSGDQLLFELEGDPTAKPDIIYLDISMPGTDGLTVAQRLRESGCDSELIFQTSSAAHALAGYDVSALHYIVKYQVDDEKFEQIFLRAVDRAKGKRQEVVTFNCAGESCTIRVCDILYFAVSDHITTVCYDADGTTRSFDFYTSMEKIESVLGSKGFLRIHRSCIIALAHVRNASWKEVVMDNDRTLPVGRAYSQLLRDALLSRNADATEAVS